jgi:hypothetical protein
MSVDADPAEPRAAEGAAALIARAAAADARADRRLTAIAADLKHDSDDLLDEQARSVLARELERLVRAVEADIRHHADRVLGGPGRLATRHGLLARLLDAGLLDERGLLHELVSRARMEIIADALPPVAPDEAERPSLLSRLVAGEDRVAAGAATALLAAESRRSSIADASRDDLPAEHHHRLVWWVAAALRRPSANGAVDRALIEAAQRALVAHDEGARSEAAAMRLARALEAVSDDLPRLVEECLADRQLALFVASLAQGLGFDFDLARDMALDPGGDRLLLALRALDFDRGPIARIALALGEADRRRDPQGVADQLEAAMTISPDAARAALSELKLPADYRLARHRLGAA